MSIVREQNSKLWQSHTTQQLKELTSSICNNIGKSGKYDFECNNQVAKQWSIPFTQIKNK